GCLGHVHGDGPSESALEDGLGRGGALVPAFAAGGGGVLERVVYDAYGKPTFEDAFNNPIVSPATGRFLAESQYHNDHLFRGLRYDPELGARGTSVNNDFGGLYGDGLAYNPNEGRSMDGPGAAVETKPGPISSPVDVMGPHPMPWSPEDVMGPHPVPWSPADVMGPWPVPWSPGDVMGPHPVPWRGTFNEITMGHAHGMTGGRLASYGGSVFSVFSSVGGYYDGNKIHLTQDVSSGRATGAKRSFG